MKSDELNAYARDLFGFLGILNLYGKSHCPGREHEFPELFQNMVSARLYAARKLAVGAIERIVVASEIKNDAVEAELYRAIGRGRNGVYFAIKTHCPIPDDAERVVAFDLASSTAMRAADVVTALMTLKSSVVLLSIDIASGVMPKSTDTNGLLLYDFAPGVYSTNDVSMDIYETEFVPENTEGIDDDSDDAADDDYSWQYFGDWRHAEGDKGQVAIDQNGEHGFAAYMTGSRETLVVLWSKDWAIGEPCAPTYPGHADADTQDKRIVRKEIVGHDPMLYYALPRRLIDFD